MELLESLVLLGMDMTCPGTFQGHSSGVGWILRTGTHLADVRQVSMGLEWKMGLFAPPFGALSLGIHIPWLCQALGCLFSQVKCGGTGWKALGWVRLGKVLLLLPLHKAQLFLGRT